MIRACKNIVLIVACLLCVSTVFAQRASHIRALGRAQKKQILVRWATSNEHTWRLSNQYGFEVSRYTVIRDSIMLAIPERKVLGVFKPKPVEEWAATATKNEYAAVIAQALYGESFEVSDGGDQGILTSINKAQELEQRFALSLYAADHYFPAAVLAGWGLVDTDVKENEKYLYRIKSAVPRNILLIDSTAVFIGLKDYRELPSLNDISALFKDKTAMLSWDYNLLKDYYNSYFIERSSDGVIFYRITDMPVTRIAEEENKKSSGRVHYIDTLGMNNVRYYYRVRGVSPFGEVGPASDVVSGIGKRSLAQVPHIIRSVVTDEGKLYIKWEFERTANTLISGFILNQSEKNEGPYIPVLRDLTPGTREATYDRLFNSNYFTITAVAIDGEPTTSMPVLVQPIDSVPPLAPTNIKAEVDSNGIVKISWAPNSEKDLLGYKVFRTYVQTSEVTPLTDSIFYTTAYIDTISMRMTNRKIYYAITALDRRYNQSSFSALTVALKPDIIPPTAPLFTKYELIDYQVSLKWADCSDDDVASHTLYRKENEEKEWRMIRRFGSATPGEFIDENVKRGSQYAYILLSKDSSGMESKPAGPVSIKVTGNPDDLAVNAFDAYIDRENHYVELFWRDGVPNVEEYQLYKSIKGSPITLWKIVTHEEKRIVDEGLAINTEYVYGIKVVTQAGQMSKMKLLEVKY